MPPSEFTRMPGTLVLPVSRRSPFPEASVLYHVSLRWGCWSVFTTRSCFPQRGSKAPDRLVWTPPIGTCPTLLVRRPSAVNTRPHSKGAEPGSPCMKIVEDPWTHFKATSRVTNCVHLSKNPLLGLVVSIIGLSFLSLSPPPPASSYVANSLHQVHPLGPGCVSCTPLNVWGKNKGKRQVTHKAHSSLTHSHTYSHSHTHTFC